MALRRHKDKNRDKPRDEHADRARRSTTGDNTPDATAEEIAARLEAVTSQFATPPSPEELRRRLLGRRDEVDAPPPRQSEFDRRFPSDTLFSPTFDDDFGPDPEPGSGEDRSRTTGNYYYDPEDAWAVLGLESGASWEQIASAHRKLAMKHHPDRLLGADDEQRAASEHAMRDINVAYSVLRRLLGR